MKKIFVSAGLAAMGVAAMQTAMADDAGPQKFWNVSATLRGFYDDNYNIANNGKGSFGLELLPAVKFHMPLQQTDIGIRYTYGLYYYEDRDSLGLNPFDQTHQFDFWLDHAFNERWHGKVTDTFSLGQEPELLNSNPALPSPITYRINGDNIANHGAFNLDTEWSRPFSTSLTYLNGLFDYSNRGGMLNSTLTGIVGGASLSGLLDRIEQSASLDFKWHVQSETTLFAGYQLSWVNYTGNEPIALIPASVIPLGSMFNGIYRSSDRDNVSHYGYFGVEHQFTPNLSGSLRGGVTYTDNFADPMNPATSLSPYADLSLEYTYIPGSYVQVGFTHDISATDQVQPDRAGHITDYAENSVVYVDLNHKFTPDLTATVIGRLQNAVFQGGAANNQSDTSYGLGINLNYRVNRHFSVDTGYNFDYLVSDLARRTYTRNRVYLGLAANY